MQDKAINLFEQGYQHLLDQAFTLAARCFLDAIEFDPEFLEAHLNLNYSLEHMGAVGEAESWYRRALELEPTCLEAHLGLGLLLCNQKRFAEAEEVYQRAVRQHADSAAAWSNLGALQALTKREKEAEASLRKAMALDDSYTKAHFNLSYLCLRQGRFEEGWRALQAREPFPYANAFAFPQWQGEDLSGKSLLIGVEKGHGDMIQFARYAAVLKDRGAARVGILCHAALERLFHTLDAVDRVYSVAHALPESGWDFWAPPLSLPFHCGTRLDTIPNDLPYLHANLELIESWRARVPQAGLRVGLAWKGNPSFESDADRSLPHLNLLAPLGAVPGVCFISLQKGPGEEEAALPPHVLNLCDLASQTTDFADLAAIMAHLDLVISVDTAIAHLAGALGKACWVLLPDYCTDWRWLTERSDSPWYPSVMRLFRQSNEQQWAPVIQNVVETLLDFSKQNHE